MTDFKRENRFVVLKKRNLDRTSPDTQDLMRKALSAVFADLRSINIEQLPCVVVESDWPEYETVWEMIETRVDPNRKAMTPAELTKHWRDRYQNMRAHADALCSIAADLKSVVDASAPPVMGNQNPPQRQPHIVCLCGSTRFYNAFQHANYNFTLAGKIVLSVGFYPHSATEAHGQDLGCSPAQKQRLDDLHKRKIDLADSVYVLNVGGYIGESTASEIAYATETGKPVEYLEPVGAA